MDPRFINVRNGVYQRPSPRRNPNQPRRKPQPKKPRGLPQAPRLVPIPVAPPLPPRQRRRQRRRGRNSGLNVNNPTFTSARERVATITITPETTPGQLLYKLEANPSSAPRSGVMATQFDSWSGTCHMEVETTGNAFSKNYVILKHAPNGDPDRVPAEPDTLLNFAESGNRRGDTTRLQLDSNRTAQVTAPWSLSYNPKKPILDSDPSERNNGVFILVANGTPGAETVTLTVRFIYSFRLYGPVAKQLIPNVSGLLQSTSSDPAAPFSGATISGPGITTFSPTTISFLPGRYLVSFSNRGTGLAGGPNPTLSNGTVAVLQNSLSDTSQTKTFIFDSPTLPTIATFGTEVATTLTNTDVYAAPYTA